MNQFTLHRWALAVLWLGAAASSAARHTIDIAQTYGNVSDVSINRGIAAARELFAADADATITLFLAAGTHVIHEVGMVDFSDIGRATPNASGVLVLAGAGMRQPGGTTLSFDGFHTTADRGFPAVLFGTHVYRVAIRDLHFTRNAYTTTQGHVVRVGPGGSFVDLRVPPGLPAPPDLVDTSDPDGRFLRQYTDSADDAHVVVDPANNGTAYPPTANAQVSFTNVTHLPDDAGAGAGAGAGVAGGNSNGYSGGDGNGTVWRFATHGTRGHAVNYTTGAMLCVKSKGNRRLGDSYHFQWGDSVSFTRVRWTLHSRGCVRGGISNVRFEGCVVERPPPYPGTDITPCLATAGGGPQIGCTITEGPSYNITVVDHQSDAGGDDGIAFFNVRSGMIANAQVKDSFARGINLQRCGDGVRLQNITLVRNPLLVCPNPPC